MKISVETRICTIALNGNSITATGSPDDMSAVCAKLEMAIADYNRVEWLIAQGATVEPVGIRWKCTDGGTFVRDTWREAVDAAMAGP